MSHTSIARSTCLAMLTLAIFARPAVAAVSFFDDLASFQAVSNTSVDASFEGFSPTETPIFIPPAAPITLGGVTFTPGSTSSAYAPNLYVATPNTLLPFSVDPASNVLTMLGNENFQMDFADAPTAVGFETYLNESDPPVVKVYDTLGNLLATHTLTQEPGTRGFLGITSSAPIGTVTWRASQGNSVNTAIDNVRQGDALVTTHDVTLYLHGNDVTGTAGGYTMSETPASSQTFSVNLLDSPTWYSDPAFTGTVQESGSFTLTVARTIGISRPATFRLSSTDVNGGNEIELGEITQAIGWGLQPRVISIPVDTPLSLANRRLKLTISSSYNLNVNLQIGTSTRLVVSDYVGNP